MSAGVDNVGVVPDHHVVHFYEQDEELVSGVSEFLALGLSAGDVAIVVAVPAHHAAVRAAIRGLGIDVDAAREAARYVEVDAQEALAALMVGLRPDKARFDDTVGALIARGRASGGGVRVFGEMVGLLWAAGDFAGAVELEALWNDLGARHVFSLYCGYPMSVVAGSGDLTTAKAVCDSHSAVLTPPSYAASAATSSPTFGSERSAFFVPVPLAAGAVRRFVRETLRAWSPGGSTELGALVASELATNAVRHAHSPFRVSMTLRDAVVRFSVHDASPSPPAVADIVADAIGGRGVPIVDALCLRWGTDSVADGKVVWAEFEASQ